MRLATASESRRIDELAQSEFALPSDTLMEAAGSLSAREIQQSFYPEVRRGRIGIVCGPGHNGADGLVVARHLLSESAGRRQEIIAFLVAPLDKRGPLFALQLERCMRQGLLVIDLLRDTESLRLFRSMDLIVDAVFGTGLRSEVSAPFAEVIEAMNRAQAPIVSLDIPSGLDADRGVVGSIAIRASSTITFGLAKPGFFVSDGPAHVGRLKVFSIGFPRELFKRIAVSRFAYTESMAARALPKRSAASNKASHGHALLIAGSKGMWGAAVLSASAAYRVGAGYVTLASHDDPSAIAAQSLPEALTSRTSDEELWRARKWTAVGIGPGLGSGEETARTLRRLMDLGTEKVVVDADAITVAAREKLWPLPSSWILTPHAGELSRVLGAKAKEIENDRYRFAIEAASLTGAFVLLKGYRSVFANGSKALVILSGNSALAKAGTGDVLTGMITGLLARGLAPAKAGPAGAYLHGRIADEWVRAGNDRSAMEASDLREILPGLMARLER